MNFLVKKEDGFVALFTVLLVSVILAMALGIASISLKEIVLSASAGEGSKAFYAADSGIECGLYLQRLGYLADSSVINLRCNGSLLQNPTYSTEEYASDVHKFNVPFGENNELCANIIVRSGITNEINHTVSIESKGSNMPCGEYNNPKRVERSVRVTY